MNAELKKTEAERRFVFNFTFHDRKDVDSIGPTSQVRIRTKPGVKPAYFLELNFKAPYPTEIVFHDAGEPSRIVKKLSRRMIFVRGSAFQNSQSPEAKARWTGEICRCSAAASRAAEAQKPPRHRPTTLVPPTKRRFYAVRPRTILRCRSRVLFSRCKGEKCEKPFC